MKFIHFRFPRKFGQPGKIHRKGMCTLIERKLCREKLLCDHNYKIGQDDVHSFRLLMVLYRMYNDITIPTAQTKNLVVSS